MNIGSKEPLTEVMQEVYSLYIHVPFCTRKCNYCNFYIIPDKDIFKQRYFKALRWEWELYHHYLEKKQLVSVYFGGGTPALLGSQAIGQILEWLPIESSKTQVEITLEANPENVTRALMEAYHAVGINRVSLGIQTLDSALLQRLGRLHSAEKALNSVWETAEAGIKNISIDLMYDLPGQSLEGWQRTLQQAISLPISHLSLYNLTIEPNTVFFKYRRTIEAEQPRQEVSCQMYQEAVKTLNIANLQQYEISAFARDSFHSYHNLGYWTARPFLGLGPSAFSFWEGKRFRNVAHLNRYYTELEEGRLPIDFEEKLSSTALQKELLVIQLRVLSGVDLSLFCQQYGDLDHETTTTIRKLIEKGFLLREGEHIRLSEQGILFYDDVASELI